jgi:transcription-repair coupling factor (superfamily II helicase)
MEEALESFINYDYNMLIATTIIESGIDISNVNTIIIHSAQNYGLSDLHQLRGRVGRSNRKAYCYLVTPDRELLTSDARRRLDALTTFAELGAGFQLAMQDLDIRGAGNMLGSEQSGFIADLGYDTYQRILNEAVEEIREEMLNGPNTSTLFSNTSSGTSSKNWCSDSQLDSDLPLCFPVTYIENISERISLYRELDNLANEEALLEYQKRLIDRFGKLPEEAEGYLTVTVNGTPYTQELVNGSATVNVPKLSPGKYNITVSYSGDDNYEAISKTMIVNVPIKTTPEKPVTPESKKKATKKVATKITAKKKTFKAKKKVKKYTITLKAGKKPVKKVWVTLKIKGKKLLKAKTNAKGKATFKIKKLTKKGKYKATIKFKGNKNYKTSSKKVKITIK